MKRPWLRIWAFATLACVFVMLALGALVTSFKAGMADNTWPRTPWHLFVIEWESWGLVIEHTHRFIGYLLGLLMIVLAGGTWMHEPSRLRRFGGMMSLLGVLFSGAVAMWIARVKQPTGPAAGLAELPVAQDHPALIWAAIILGSVSLLTFVGTLISTARSDAPAKWNRVFAALTLVGILVQGLLGGFRVKLNAMYGEDFAAVHGAFSQIVLAFAVLTALSTGAIDTPDSRRMHAESTARLDRWAMWAAGLVFLQVMAGVILRHSDSTIGWLGPRLHLLCVFPATLALFGTAWRIVHTAAPTGVRALAWLTFGLLALQIGLGVEAWLSRFEHGITTSALQQVTVADALLRSGHSVIGYALFATAVALAYQTRRPTELQRVLANRTLEGAV